jgi:hypothetical protein
MGALRLHDFEGLLVKLEMGALRLHDWDVCATFMHTFARLIKEYDCATMKII